MIFDDNGLIINEFDNDTEINALLVECAILDTFSNEEIESLTENTYDLGKAINEDICIGYEKDRKNASIIESCKNCEIIWTVDNKCKLTNCGCIWYDNKLHESYVAAGLRDEEKNKQLQNSCEASGGRWEESKKFCDCEYGGLPSYRTWILNAEGKCVYSDVCDKIKNKNRCGKSESCKWEDEKCVDK